MLTTHRIALSQLAPLLFGLISISTVLATEMQTYSANYSAKFNGMEIEAHHQLTQLDSGQYRQTLKASNILGNINEQADFKLVSSTEVVPINYSYKRSLLGSKRAEKQVFDWSNQQMQYSKKDREVTIPVKPGYLDIITQRLQLRLDLQAGKEHFSYPVISRGKLKLYDYEIVSYGILDTAIGPLNTVRVQRIRKDNKRQTKIWFATDWDYLAVKLELIKDGDSHEMNIINGQVGSQPVRALDIVTEK
jgi:hypothetical protein